MGQPVWHQQQQAGAAEPPPVLLHLSWQRLLHELPLCYQQGACEHVHFMTCRMKIACTALASFDQHVNALPVEQSGRRSRRLRCCCCRRLLLCCLPRRLLPVLYLLPLLLGCRCRRRCLLCRDACHALGSGGGARQVPPVIQQAVCHILLLIILAVSILCKGFQYQGFDVVETVAAGTLVEPHGLAAAGACHPHPEK